MLAQLLADRLSHDFAAFAQRFFNVWRPQERLDWHEVFDYACEWLTDVAQGRCKRLLWNHPPRLLKSYLFSIAWPAWIWTRAPETTFLFASCSMNLATEFSIARRNLITSALYQMLWGSRFRLSSDQNRVDSYANDRGGSMVAVGVGSDTIGRGGSILCFDDLLTPEGAVSDAERKGVNRWLFNSFLNRLNDSSMGRIVGVMQRLHVDDPTAALMEAEPGQWKNVSVPLEAPEDMDITLPRSGRVWHRNRGDILLRSRFPQHEIENRKKRFYEWSSQMQQEPCPLEGNVLKASSIRYYSARASDQQRGDAPPPQRFGQIIISVDSALRTGQANDFSAIGTVGITGHKRWVLDMVNERLDVTQIEQRLVEQRRLFPGSVILIEGKAAGDPVASRLKSVLGMSGVVTWDPRNSKPARFLAMAAEFAAGDWYLPRDREFTEALVAQLVAFPGRYDDMCDALSQVSEYLVKHGGVGWDQIDLTTGRSVAGADEWWNRPLDEVLRESERERLRQSSVTLTRQ